MNRKPLKRILQAALLMACLGPAARAQDIHFSQFYELSVLRNPALTGIFTGDYKVGVLYRNQWSSVGSAFQTAVVNAEVRMPVSSRGNDFVSFGLASYYDKAGSAGLQQLALYPAINYNKSLEDARQSFLSVGFTAGYNQRSFDPARMTFDEQYQNGAFSSANPTGELLPNPSLSQWDLGAGVSFSSSSGEDNQTTYYLGLAAYHLTRPRQAFFNEQRYINAQVKWNAGGGMGFRIDDSWRLLAHANYMLQGKNQELIAGGLLRWSRPEAREAERFALYGGLFWRVNDALVPSFRMDYRDYSFSLSYDVNVSTLRAASQLRGGFEISAFKTGMFRSDRYERSRTICPKF